MNVLAFASEVLGSVAVAAAADEVDEAAFVCFLFFLLFLLVEVDLEGFFRRLFLVGGDDLVLPARSNASMDEIKQHSSNKYTSFMMKIRCWSFVISVASVNFGNSKNQKLTKMK